MSWKQKNNTPPRHRFSELLLQCFELRAFIFPDQLLHQEYKVQSIQSKVIEGVEKRIYAFSNDRIREIISNDKNH